MPELSNPKLIDRDQIGKLRVQWRHNGQTVVFTNGCFDLLHAGHVYYLKRANELGDLLIVGLNSDTSMKKLAKRSEPIQSQTDRAYVLSGLEAVDYIALFDEETPAALIQSVMPDVLVKGNDYSVEDIVGADTVLESGGQVQTIPLLSGRSTTNIAERIRKMTIASEGKSA